MRVLRSADYKRMPWKNGKGETVEIAVFPPGATVDTFDWRISTATVAEDGPFSIFEGVDRTLSVLSGEGLILSVAGRDDVTLEQGSDPYAFPADMPTQARLVAGAITDLNVMTRRGVFENRVFYGPLLHRLLPAAPMMRVLVTRSPLTICQGRLCLQTLDALILDPGETVALEGDGAAAVFLVELVGCASLAASA